MLLLCHSGIFVRYLYTIVMVRENNKIIQSLIHSFICTPYQCIVVWSVGLVKILSFLFTVLGFHSGSPYITSVQTLADTKGGGGGHSNTRFLLKLGRMILQNVSKMPGKNYTFHSIFYLYTLLTISCIIYLFLTPNSRSVFRAGVSLNTRSFIH